MPGSYADIDIAHCDRLRFGQPVTLSGPGVLTLDGEREIVLGPLRAGGSHRQSRWPARDRRGCRGCRGAATALPLRPCGCGPLSKGTLMAVGVCDGPSWPSRWSRGTILRWLVPDATEVSAGDAVLLVETDKVETEIEASGSGVLHQTGEIGQEYLCGVPFGWFCEPGERPAGRSQQSRTRLRSPLRQHPLRSGTECSPARSSGDRSRSTRARRRHSRPLQPASAPLPVVRAPGERILASPAAKRLARELGVELAVVAGSGPKGRITERDVRAAAETPATAEPVPEPGVAPTPAAGAGAASARVMSPSTAAVEAAGPSPPATLAARQLADLLGVDLRAVRASAPDGRISRADVAVAVREMLARLSPSAEPEPAAAPEPESAAPLAQEPTELIPLRGMRGVIAERMSASLRSMAQLTLTMDVDMSAVVAERAALVEAVPGYTDYLVAAAAAALQQHPRVNSQVTDDAVAVLGDIHIGLAVALDDGLLVPVVRHADRLSLGEIAAETTRLAEGARDGSLDYDDYQGATFTVTALGMFGVDAFTPIINSPNTAILGVGRIRDETIWTEGVPAARPMLTLSLTWDHRAFDGAPAARFTAAVRDWLESR